MGDHVVGEIESHISNVFMPVEMLLAGSRNRLRLRADEVVHDRQIVWREVPENIDVMLEKTEIDARGIVVIKLPQRAFVEELGDLLDSSGKQECMIHHDR